MTEIMATSIREDIAILDDNDNVLFIMFFNKKHGITIEQENPMDAPYFSATFTKEDWEDIKAFIDKQFND